MLMKSITLFLLCVALRAQTHVVTPLEMAPNLPDQKIGPRDLIVLQVYDSPELSRTMRVGADGLIRLPMMKHQIQAEGLMPNELEAAVSKTFKDEGLLVDPFITITVAEYSSRPISVLGAVKSPLTFLASSPVTLLEAITRAGGLTPETGPEILISRNQPGPDGSIESQMQRVPVKALINSADPSANLKLTGGEEIRVPEAGKVFVVGNVRKPGAFAVQDGASSSVLKMLAVAEGLAPFAGKKAYIYRADASGSKNEIEIELHKIMGRKAPDAPLLPNDVLYIPDDQNRRLSMATLEKMLLFGSTAGATALLYGR
jgi:polysaccharide biosynthesis/export protein